MKKINKQVSLSFVVAATISLGFMSTDIYAPSMPEMGLFFNVKDALIQITVGSCLLGAALSGLISGVISDHWGRRPVMVGGLILFVFASIICVLTPSVFGLIIGRFLQGCGIGVFNVVGLATIQDIYPPRQGAKIMARMEMFFTILPTLAPIIGGYVHSFLGWRANFWIILIVSILILYGTFVLFKEPLKRPKNEAFQMKSFFHNYKLLIANRTYMSFVVLSPLLYSAEICVMTLFPYYSISYWGLGPNFYGLWVGFIFSCYGVGSLIACKIVDQIGLKRTIFYGLMIVILSSSCLLFASLDPNTSPTIMAIFLGFHEIAMAIIYAPSIAKALSVVHKAKGTASAIPNLLVMIAASFGAFLSGFSNDHSITLGAIALVIASFSETAIFLSITLKDRMFGAPALKIQN